MPAICHVEGCRKQPSYNFPGLKAHFCPSHKQEGMVRVHGYLCLVCGCVASYKKPGDSRPRYCSKHGRELNANSVLRTCGCPRQHQPSFGFADDPRPTKCSACREDGMVNLVRHPRCEVCGKQANFGLPDTKPTHCSTHGTPLGMVDLMSKRCSCGSGKQVSYGFKSDSQRIACAACKSDGMFNLKNPYCDHPECTTPGDERIASYGFPDGGMTRCSYHKEEGMTFQRNPLCACGNQMTYGLPGEKATRCTGCQEPGMVNVASCRCVECHETIVRHKNSKCSYCRAPALQKKERHETMIVRDFHDDPSIPEFVFNKSIGKENGRFRPDLLFRFPDKIVILEIDEFQHKYYDRATKDKERMVQIQDALGVPTLFLRFNPDAYKIGPRTYKTQMKQRLVTLKKRLHEMFTHTPTKDVEVEYLFYDT